MKLQRYGAIAGIALTATIALAACGKDNTDKAGTGAPPPKNDCASGTLNLQGSTAQKNAIGDWSKAYQTKCSGATINYNANGSGAGVKAFIDGTADFAGSDSALKDGDEQANADKRCTGGKAIHLPMVTGPVAVVFNVTGVSELQLKPATLAKVFDSKITKWDDAAIKADNPSATLPSTPIKAVHRSDESGTTDNYTSYLAAAAASDWTYGHAKAWKGAGGVAEKGSDGVAASVSKNDGSIGYVELSFAQSNSLKMAKLYNGAGEWVALTPEAAGKTVSAAKVTGSGDDLKLKIDYATKEAGAYPLILVTYEIVCGKGNPADKVALIKSFLGYTSSSDGQSKLTSGGYAPLPETVRAKVEAATKNLA